MPKPRMNFKRMPAGQQRAHINQAAEAVLRAAGGNSERVTMGHVRSVAGKLGVPEEEVAKRLRERGLDLR